MKKSGAVIQSRLSSTRLPGKVIADILGKPMIVRLVEQISYSKHLDEIIVATSTEPSDDMLCDVCHKHGIEVMRGVLANVMKRYHDVADARELDIVFRITGDNPLTDPFLIDDMIDDYRNNPDIDYINNVHRDGSVHGSGVELVTRTALNKAMNHIMMEKDPSRYMEHVTLFIRLNTELFRTKKYYRGKHLNRADVSYSVDHPEDLALVREVFKALYSRNTAIKTCDILDYLDKNPDLRKINSHLHSPLPTY